VYLDAVRIDPRNRAARMNLGNMLLRSQDYSLAIEQLEQAITESIASGTAATDPVYYTGRFRLAAAYYEVKRYNDALSETARLLHDIDDQLRAFETTPDASGADPTTRLARYLRSARPAVAVMLAGMRVRAGTITPAKAFRNCDLSEPSSSFQYNVACTAAICFEFSPQPDEQVMFVQIALARLAFALRLNPRFAARAEIDNSLKCIREGKATRLAFAAVVDGTGQFRAARESTSPKGMSVDDGAALVSRFPHATKADNDALLALHGKHVTRSGLLSITNDRSPDYFALLRCRGGKSHVLVQRDFRGGIAAAGSVTIRRGYLRGHETVVGYLGDLRVERKATAPWRTTLDKLARDSQLYSTATISDSNLPALRSLVERPGEFVFERLLRYQAVTVIAKALPVFKDVPTLAIRRATPADYEALALFLERRNERKAFGYVNPLERLEIWPGFSIDRFFLAIDAEQQIRGTLAIWNPELTQRYVVNGRLKLSINYLTHVEVDDEATFGALVDAVRNARDLPRAHVLSFCDDDARPLRGALGGLIRTTTPAIVYAVRHRDLPPLGSPANGVGFELALA
jgi:tetratricopeptide (TPR) repeat protein